MNLSVSFIYVLMNFMIIPAIATQGGTIFEYFDRGLNGKWSQVWSNFFINSNG